MTDIQDTNDKTKDKESHQQASTTKLADEAFTAAPNKGKSNQSAIPDGSHNSISEQVDEIKSAGTIEKAQRQDKLQMESDLSFQHELSSIKNNRSTINSAVPELAIDTTRFKNEASSQTSDVFKSIGSMRTSDSGTGAIHTLEYRSPEAINPAIFESKKVLPDMLIDVTHEKQQLSSLPLQKAEMSSAGDVIQQGYAAANSSSNLKNALFASKDFASKDFASKDFASKDFASKDFASKDFASKDFASKDFTSDQAKLENVAKSVSQAGVIGSIGSLNLEQPINKVDFQSNAFAQKVAYNDDVLKTQLVQASNDRSFVKSQIASPDFVTAISSQPNFAPAREQAIKVSTDAQFDKDFFSKANNTVAGGALDVGKVLVANNLPTIDTFKRSGDTPPDSLGGAHFRVDAGGTFSGQAPTITDARPLNIPPVSTTAITDARTDIAPPNFKQVLDSHTSILPDLVSNHSANIALPNLKDMAPIPLPGIVIPNGKDAAPFDGHIPNNIPIPSGKDLAPLAIDHSLPGDTLPKADPGRPQQSSTPQTDRVPSSTEPAARPAAPVPPADRVTSSTEPAARPASPGPARDVDNSSLRDNATKPIPPQQQEIRSTNEPGREPAAQRPESNTSGQQTARVADPIVRNENPQAQLAQQKTEATIHSNSDLNPAANKDKEIAANNNSNNNHDLNNSIAAAAAAGAAEAAKAAVTAAAARGVEAQQSSIVNQSLARDAQQVAAKAMLDLATQVKSSSTPATDLSSAAAKIGTPVPSPLNAALTTSPLGASLTPSAINGSLTASPLNIALNASPLNAALTTSPLGAALTASANASLTAGALTAAAEANAAGKAQPLDGRVSSAIDAAALLAGAGRSPLSVISQTTLGPDALIAGKPGLTTTAVQLGTAFGGVAGVRGDVSGRLPGLTGRSLVVDNAGNRRYLTGLEIGLLIAAVGIAKSRNDSSKDAKNGKGEKDEALENPLGKFSLADGARRFPGRELTLSALLALTGASKVRDIDMMLGIKSNDRTVRIERTIGGMKKEKIEMILPQISIETTGSDNNEDNTAKLDSQLLGLLPAAPAFLRARRKDENEGNEQKLAKEKEAESSSNTKVPVLRYRRVHQVLAGESLVSIAESKLKDANLAWLIADINASKLTERHVDGRRVVEVISGANLELPLASEVAAFYKRDDKAADPDNLVTIVLEPEFDKDRIERHLNEVLGLARSAV